MSVNKVILVGHVGRDPEVRFTGGGQAVANFSLATSEAWKDKSGERKERTEWHRVVIWGKLAEIVKNFAQKGTQVYVEGRIQTREWEKGGDKRTTTEIVADTFRILSGGKRSCEQGAAQEPESQVSDEDPAF